MNQERELDAVVQKIMRMIPSMDKILSDKQIKKYEGYMERQTLKNVCLEVLSDWRRKIQSGAQLSFDEKAFFTELAQRLRNISKTSLCPLINATGVVVHTNLGRACLAEEAVDAAAAVGLSYSTLEYDLSKGERGHRNSHVEWLLCQITGAEAAIVVNNNAAAVLLVLAALAAGKETIVSRGELVEIGGSFRIPDIMNFAGSHMIEVGCTNRTHLFDYERAIGDDTAMLMKVHPSNFRITGFVTSPQREELAQLAHSHGLLFVEDLGSGCLINAKTLGLEGEDTVREILDTGVDLVTFSGDKLLGGPQIGVIAGKREFVDKLRRFPLLRALRCDKMTFAALEATLRVYLRGDWEKIPTLEMISANSVELKKKAEVLCRRIDSECGKHLLRCSVVEVEDAVGGGSYPEFPLAGLGVALVPASLSGGVAEMQQRLRTCSHPVIAAVHDDELIIHVRTVREFEIEHLISSLQEVLVDRK